jgi:hypothetical protein
LPEDFKGFIIFINFRAILGYFANTLKLEWCSNLEALSFFTAEAQSKAAERRGNFLCDTPRKLCVSAVKKYPRLKIRTLTREKILYLFFREKCYVRDS